MIATIAPRERKLLMFNDSHPVSPEQFIGRRYELRRIASRLAQHGQSTAVVGQPRTGKTSVLSYFTSPVGLGLIQSRTATRLNVTYLDAHALPKQFDHVYFWKHVLEPALPLVDAADAYAACRAAAFEPQEVEAVLGRMREADVRLIVLIDEFDHLVRNRVADPVRFFGTLRSLATRSGALALLLASRSRLRVLDGIAQQNGYSGSPYFNFVTEIALGPFSDDDVEALLDLGQARFSAEDRRYLREAAGGHPFLLQAAATALWDAYEDDYERPRERRAAAASMLRSRAANALEDVWEYWSGPVRQAFASVAIDHLNALSDTPEHFQGTGSIVDRAAFEQEIDGLLEQGFITEDAGKPPRLRVQSLVFLDWCLRKLRQPASSAEGWMTWLSLQGWDLSPPLRHAWLDLARPRLLSARVNLDLFTAKDPLPLAPRSRAPRSGAPRSPVQVRIYFSHAQADGPLVAQLANHLTPLQREGMVRVWNSRDITAGDDQRHRLDENLKAADVILLCVSADYVASDYCWDVEVELALHRSRLGEARVIPVVLRPADWRSLPFGGLDPLPRSGKAVSAWTNQDEAWLDVVQGIRAEIERLAGRERAETTAVTPTFR